MLTKIEIRSNKGGKKMKIAYASRTETLKAL